MPGNRMGDGEWVFEPVENWPKLPAEIGIGDLGDVAGLAVDAQDRVYMFNRGKHPVLVLDREGNVLRSWGHGLFSNPHAASIGPDDSIYLTDNGDHTVRKFSLDGKLLLQIGQPGKPSGFMSGKPFCRCTHTALSPEGDIYVSDGYGNACVHKYAPDGRHLFSWGRPGTGPGEFNLPHNICCDAEGLVYVADRENHRIQVFDGQGRYIRQVNNLHRPCGLALFGGRCPCFLVGELGPYQPVNRATPNLGPRLSIMGNDGTLLARLGGLKAGLAPGEFVAPHSVVLDSRGDLYVGEVAATDWASLFPEQPRPDRLRRVQKFARVRAA
jgi:DNA-binding beta-propeller fold protein YncE